MVNDAIAEQVLRAVGNLDATDPIGRQAHVLLERLRTVLAQPEALEAMAQAQDAEQAACMGEPSPWREDIAGQDAEWKSERRTAMLCALQAVGLA